MQSAFDDRQEYLRQRADAQARLALIPYDGTPEIKENDSGRYLYVKRREAGKLQSVYVGVYSDQLYTMLLQYNRDSRALKKQIREIEKKLAELGYTGSSLSVEVERNLGFARANMKSCIYDQAVLEGVSTTFPQTETIIENGVVSGMTPSDIQKIVNLKHAWEFILDKDVLSSPSDYYVLCHIDRLVNEGFPNTQGGRIRGVPVSIGGSSYVPPLPLELDVKDHIRDLTQKGAEPIEAAIDLCLYCMKTQIFLDGNKRAAVIFANHYLIAHGGGLLVIPEADVQDFRGLLVAYYEDRSDAVRDFMKEKCWRRM